ncbi:putative Ig domain-containing protein [Photobacterium damselae]|uniref:putative Ig domain-containing protein n=1 Tax=Photobacterium damselae TaxID=38293 RepID=UPI00406894CA
MVATPPTVAQIPKLTVVAEQTLSFQVIARSNIGKVLKYELSNAPSWISIDSQTGLITIEPSFSDLGNISFNIIVSDGDLSTTSQPRYLLQNTI